MLTQMNLTRILEAPPNFDRSAQLNRQVETLIEKLP